MCVLLPSGETRNYINIRKERSRLWDHSAIGVAATMATVAPLASTPPTGGSICNGGISGYPIVIRGLVMTRKCPSQGRARGKTRNRTAHSQSMSSRGAPRCVVFLGCLRSDPGLEWLSCGGEGRAYLQGGKPLLELIASAPQIFLLYPLTPASISPTSEVLIHFTHHVAKYPIQVGILAIALLAVTAWSSKRPALGFVFFP